MCKLLGGKWIDCSGGTGKNVGRIKNLLENETKSSRRVYFRLSGGSPPLTRVGFVYIIYV